MVDIRIHDSFRNSRKRKRLEKRLGPGAVLCVIDLWIAIAINRPRGILTNWDEEDIAIESGWDGDPKTFVDALIETRFLSQNGDGNYECCNWKRRQPWAYYAPDRSRKARNAAKKRWEKRYGNQDDNATGNAGSIKGASDGHPDGTAPSPAPAPAPAPAPKKSKKPLSGNESPDPANVIIKQAIEYLNERTGKKFHYTSQSSQKFIRGRLSQGYTIVDLKNVIDTMVSQWGDDDRMKKYLRPETLFNETKFQTYVNMDPEEKIDWAKIWKDLREKETRHGRK